MALVITIIILIILAAISLSAIFSENGLINQAKQGGQRYKEEEVKEQQTLESINTFLTNNGTLNSGNAENNENEEENKLYLIQNGITTNEFQTANMEKFNINTSINDYSTVIKTDNIQHNRAVVTFRNIDLTDFSKIGIDYKVNNKTGDSGLSLAILQNSANVGVDDLEKYEYLINFSETSKERTTFYLEDLPSGIHALSLLKGSTLSTTQVDYNVYSLWLEKTDGQKTYIIQNGNINNTYELLNTNVLNESSNPNVFGLTNATNTRAGAYIDNLDVTGYSKIGIDYEVENKTGNAMFNFSLFGTEQNILTDDAFNQLVLLTSSDTSKERTTEYLENFEAGTYKLCLNKNATSANTYVKFKIYNLWLEK